MTHGPELSGNSAGLVNDNAHMVYQHVPDLISSLISGGLPGDDVNLPPPVFSLHHNQRRLSSDVQIMIV